MGGKPSLRHAVRVLLLDERDSLLLFRAEDPEDGSVFWFPAGGGVEDGEDAQAAAKREVFEETGLTDLRLGPEVWHRRHMFTWRGVELDQRERWFLARVARFEPDGRAMTENEKLDLKECRWWTLQELETTGDLLTPRDLALRLRSLLADGLPLHPFQVGI
jgi:8-oxo-dGTP pyrophosphatase MutT (NUDIX family)